MISFLTANTGASIEEIKALPFHEFMDYANAVDKIKQQEAKAILGDDSDGTT